MPLPFQLAHSKPDTDPRLTVSWEMCMLLNAIPLQLACSELNFFSPLYSVNQFSFLCGLLLYCEDMEAAGPPKHLPENTVSLQVVIAITA